MNKMDLIGYDAEKGQVEARLKKKISELLETNQELLVRNASLEQQIEQNSQQLLSKEHQYKTLVNKANDIIYTTDDRGYFLMMNPNGLKHFGYKEEEIIGTLFVDFLHEDYREAIVAFYFNMKVKRIEESYFEFPVRTVNEDMLWIGQSVTRIIEKDQVYYSSVARDITEKVNSLKALKRVNSRFSALLGNMIDGILLENISREVVLANQSFIDMFNMPVKPEQLVGLNCEDLCKSASDIFINSSNFQERINEIIKKQEIVIEEEIYAKDGRIFLRNFIPVQIDGEKEGGLWYYKDNTDRRNRELIIERSEEKYRGIMENMDLGIMEVDVNDTIVRVYDRFLEMTGYRKEELIGKKAKETLVVNEFYPVLEAQDASRLNHVSGAYEMKVKHKDDSEIWVLVSGAPYYNELGEVAGSIGLHYDITKRKQLERELEVAKEEAVNAQQAEKQFLASMSHEIRTPLNAIIGMTHLLEGTRLGAEQSDYLNVLANSASLLKNLISDILDISKIDAGTIDLQKRPVDLEAIGKKLMLTISPKVKGQNVQFKFNIDSSIRCSVLSDHQLLSQVLLNLLSNSSKFTSEGSVALNIDLIKENNSSLDLYFEVSDTGIGMDEEEIKLVFDQFTQANLEIRDEYGGTGLGLTISKRLVDLLGGELKARSVKEEGSAFYFYLTVDKGPSLDELAGERVKAKGKNKSFRGKSVLVVEDNLMNIKYLTTLLKKWDFEYDVAKNGQEAVDKFRKYKFDMVFMDLQMPVLDGYEASKKIRMLNGPSKDVPIIALTASTFLSKKHLALKAGFSDFISKPFTPSQILDVVFKYFTPSDKEKYCDMIFEFNDRLDHGFLKKIYGEDIDYAYEMFSTFLEVIDGEVELLSVLIKGDKHAELKRALHKIKPIFSMVGLTDLSEDIGVLQNSIELQLTKIHKTQLNGILERLKIYIPLLENEKNRLYQRKN